MQRKSTLRCLLLDSKRNGVIVDVGDFRRFSVISGDLQCVKAKEESVFMSLGCHFCKPERVKWTGYYDVFADITKTAENKGRKKLEAIRKIIEYIYLSKLPDWSDDTCIQLYQPSPWDRRQDFITMVDV